MLFGLLKINEQKNEYDLKEVYSYVHLSHLKYNVQNGNSAAQDWKYNGIEYEDAIGVNIYEMDFRQYDPAIARWTVMVMVQIS